METGIARKIDDLGRIVIPAETRRLFNIREGDHLFISVEGSSIVLAQDDRYLHLLRVGDPDHPVQGPGRLLLMSISAALLSVSSAW